MTTFAVDEVQFSWVERLPVTQEAAGSRSVAPAGREQGPRGTSFRQELRDLLGHWLRSFCPRRAQCELSTAKNHTGNIWLSELNVGDSTFDPSIAQAVYGAGAKLDWHIHPGGQVLLITEGTGYYQEKGKPIQIVHKGDVIKCRLGVEHWQGAAPNSSFAYIAVTPTQKGKTVWLKPVTDEEYSGAK